MADFCEVGVELAVQQIVFVLDRDHARQAVLVGQLLILHHAQEVSLDTPQWRIFPAFFALSSASRASSSSEIA